MKRFPSRNSNAFVLVSRSAELAVLSDSYLRSDSGQSAVCELKRFVGWSDPEDSEVFDCFVEHSLPPCSLNVERNFERAVETAAATFRRVSSVLSDQQTIQRKKGPSYQISPCRQTRNRWTFRHSIVRTHPEHRVTSL